MKEEHEELTVTDILNRSNTKSVTIFVNIQGLYKIKTIYIKKMDHVRNVR